MSGPLKCAECGVELTTADAEDIVRTDAGPVHRECFEGPVPPPSQPDKLEVVEEPFLTGDPAPWYLATDFSLIDADAEEAARQDHGDPPLPYDSIAELPDGSRVITEHKVGADLHRGDPAGQAERYEQAMARPDYDRADIEMQRMEREQRDYGGRYDEEGRVY